jgi:hypothetical protein
MRRTAQPVTATIYLEVSARRRWPILRPAKTRRRPIARPDDSPLGCLPARAENCVIRDGPGRPAWTAVEALPDALEGRNHR